MNRVIGIALSMVTTALLAGCDSAPGRHAIDVESVPPDKILDFNVLYRTNCAGCHGPDGRGGAATALANPIYLAIADDGVLRRVTADGMTGTPMPAFARRSGGMLTDAQIDTIVKGIRTAWRNPGEAVATDLPPYSDQALGDARRGADVFATFCSSCHGAGGRGARGGSSVVDGSYLALVSDQGLRTTVIAGRPDLGAPDWRGNVGGRTMAPQDISDVVAWLSAQRH
jgi:cytochrome c oxidase cbb3-type subunit 3